MITLPEEFKSRTQELLNAEWDTFQISLQNPCRASLRINPLKTNFTPSNSQNIPWCKTAYYLNSKPVFTLDPYFHAGHYYVQEANSMILEKVIQQLNLKTNVKVLDLCAAPGGKSTHLISLLDDDAFIHCHEVNNLRAEILRQNIEKWGSTNTLTSTGPLHKLLASGVRYDLIVLDAPCSGEGMFRKETESIKQWNLNKIHHCVNMQSDLIKIAEELLEEDGYLIYSTCTYNIEENELAINKLIKENKFISIPIQSIKEANMLVTHNHLVHTARALPHRMEGEGFTISVLRKNSSSTQTGTKNKVKISLKNQKFDEWLNYNKFPLSTIYIDNVYYALNEQFIFIVNALYNSGLKLLSMGCPLGHYKGADWFPSQGLATNIALSTDIPKINLEIDEALHYLRATENYLPSPTSDSTWQLVKYDSAALGWVKKIGIKYKNYYPKNMRIHSL